MDTTTEQRQRQFPRAVVFEEDSEMRQATEYLESPELLIAASSRFASSSLTL